MNVLDLHDLMSFCTHVALSSSLRGTDTLFHPIGGPGNFIYTLATGPQETEVARLVSPMVSSPEADLCVSFWYHMFGSHIGALHIKQRKQTADGQAHILLWTVSGHQGNRWREGRVLVPRTNKPYQVSGSSPICPSASCLGIYQQRGALYIVGIKKKVTSKSLCALFKGGD